MKLPGGFACLLCEALTAAVGGPRETSVEHKLFLVTGNVSSGQAQDWYRDLLLPFLCLNTIVLSGIFHLFEI